MKFHKHLKFERCKNIIQYLYKYNILTTCLVLAEIFTKILMSLYKERVINDNCNNYANA